MKRGLWILAAFAGGGATGLFYGLMNAGLAAAYVGTLALGLMLTCDRLERSPIIFGAMLGVLGVGVGFGAGLVWGAVNENPVGGQLGVLLGGLFALGMAVTVVILRRNRVADIWGRVLLFTASGFIFGLIVMAPFGLWIGILAEMDRKTFYPFLGTGPIRMDTDPPPMPPVDEDEREMRGY